MPRAFAISFGGTSCVSQRSKTCKARAVTAVAARVLDVEVNIAGENLVFFGIEASGPGPLVVLPVVFGVVTVVLMCIGDGLARAFRQLDNLDAYSLDIVGSILGSVGFAVLAFVHAPPLVWGLIIAAVVFFLIVRPIAKMQIRQKAAEVTAAPTTKECPFCLSSIPIKASRCPHCTSQLTA